MTTNTFSFPNVSPAPKIGENCSASSSYLSEGKKLKDKKYSFFSNFKDGPPKLRKTFFELKAIDDNPVILIPSSAFAKTQKHNMHVINNFFIFYSSFCYHLSLKYIALGMMQIIPKAGFIH